MSTLTLQSSTVKNIKRYAGKVYVFTAAGVDVYQPSIAGWSRVGFAALKNVTCGAVNDVGVWLGTSDRGVWYAPKVVGDATLSLVNIYRTVGNGTDVVVLSDAVVGMDGMGQRLLVITSGGAHYFPSPARSYTYSVSGLPGSCTMSATKIAYAVASGCHVRNNPTGSWTAGTSTQLSTSSTPALSSNTVRHMQYGTDLFIATDAGLNIYDNADISTLAAATDVKCSWPSSAATQSAGIVAYGTGSDAKLYNITGSAELDSIANATEAIWVDDLAEALVYDNNLEAYTQVTALSPGDAVSGVRRDWSLYLEVTDSLHGVDDATLDITVNGAAVTPTVSDLGSGVYAVTFTPASASGYREKVIIALTGDDLAGNPISHSWNFTTATRVNAEPSLNPPPQVVVIKDLSLAAIDAEESYGGVNVIWAEEISSPLIVSEAQAQAVGTVEIEGRVYHRHVRTLRVLATDSNGDATLALNQGSIITFTCSALGESTKKAEVLAVQRNVSDNLDGSQEYTLLVAYYDIYEA